MDRYSRVEHLGDGIQFVDSILGILDHIQLFEDFGQDEVWKLARYLQACRVSAGVEFIREGEPGDYLFLIVSGVCEIVKHNQDGFAVRIGLAGPGKTLGEMSLIDGAPRSASCLALRDVVFAVLHRADMMRILREEPQLGIKLLLSLLQILSHRLREANAKIVGAGSNI